MTDERMTSLQVFRGLFDIHQKVHSTGRKVLIAIDGGKADEARALLHELTRLSKDVVAALDELKQVFS